ncbi:hypothetical protein [Chromobacterium sphagni]|uniref:Uncharacterized protein n=1 Tax=Chromobacterium sphagni TaxID=1903179 RepID=A0A1S1X2A7_9NEIS|nr:hypothetical protein [Chromobacterium sphagni]OHX13651.1 hypothetical protein BI347_09085 [Chromobacterium sphagni]OHX18028.1 hypothetical protein BI344_10805 [Chromobacterium sphagni]
MFYVLFGTILIVVAATAAAAARFFDPAVAKILGRTIGEELAFAWRKYVFFAIVVTGISGGVRPWSLERYLAPAPGKGSTQLALGGERWMLELFQAFISTLQSIAWVVLLFFLCAMLAYVVMRAVEFRRQEAESRRNSGQQ